MKIQLVIVDENPRYLEQLTNRLAAEHPGRLEIHAFSDVITAQAALASFRPHVLLVSDTLEIDRAVVPQRTAFARLVDSAGVATIDGVVAVARFIRLDEFYRQVVALLDHSVGSMQMRARRADGGSRLVPVLSPAGGVGTSTVAIAVARAIASQPDGPSVLYLALGACDDPSSSLGHDPTGGPTLSDAIFAVKRRRGNLELQLDACTVADRFGVRFLATASAPADVLELDDEDRSLLLEHFLGSGTYDVIVLDIPFDLTPGTVRVLDRAHAVVLTTDGSQAANAKVLRAVSLVEQLDTIHETSVLPRTGLVYNRASSQRSRLLEGLAVPTLATVSRYSAPDEEQVLHAVLGSGQVEPLVQAVLA